MAGGEWLVRASTRARLSRLRPRPSAKKTHSAGELQVLGLATGDSMPTVPDMKQADLSIPAQSSVPTSLAPMSDDECISQLARAVEHHDASRLEEVARLIGRLAVTIE